MRRWFQTLGSSAFGMATVVLLVTVLSATPSRAVSQAGGIIDQFVAGARADAMANVYALSDGGPFAVHLNPAALALPQSASLGVGKGNLAAGLADDVWIGHAGATLRYGPFGFGAMHSRLDQGEQTATDEFGNPTGTFTSYQTSMQLGAGVSLLEWFAPEQDPRTLMLTVGANVKRIFDHLAPDGVFEDGATEASAFTVDAGVVARAGFLFEERPGISAGPSRLGIRVAVAFDDVPAAELDFGTQKDPLPRSLHTGIALEGQLLPHRRIGHLLEFTLLYEKLFSKVESDDTEVTKKAVEVVAAGLVSLRMGQYSDPEGDITAPTVGVGLGLEWAGLPRGARLEWSSRPQATGLERVDYFALVFSESLFD